MRGPFLTTQAVYTGKMVEEISSPNPTLRAAPLHEEDIAHGESCQRSKRSSRNAQA